MRAKTKYKMGLWLIAIIVVIGVVAAVVVGKMIHDSEYSNLTVAYKSTGVQGTASANVYYGEDIIPLTTNGLTNGNQKIAFTGKEKEDKAYHLLVPTQKGAEATILLNAEHTQIVFEYIFSNTSDKDWQVSLSLLNQEFNNVNLLVSSVQNEKLADLETITTDVQDSFLVQNAVISAGSVRYIYFKISVNNVFSNASFTGNLMWELGEVKD